MFFTEDAPAFPAELPLTIDFATGAVRLEQNVI
jgi:hypothetical protein